ncbi:hypothetical protein TNCT_654911 [Trichonephila clavata]|uniref:Uncharacterized protein n=1 Tax=Trichonephila clavata TaxID=2740835 RepID=A0A8X6LRT4_TRICU|nr:hypothetical protein TNCT_654911 [Trichonephila clavata]
MLHQAAICATSEHHLNQQTQTKKLRHFLPPMSRTISIAEQFYPNLIPTLNGVIKHPKRQHVRPLELLSPKTLITQPPRPPPGVPIRDKIRESKSGKP